MERLHYRSTSLIDLQAELRHADLLAEASRPRVPPATVRPHRRLFGFRILRRRARR